MPSFDRNTTGKEVVEAFASTLEGKTGKVRERQKPGDTLTYITVVITGPSTKSIGAEIAISLAYASPSSIILLGRTESKIAPVIEQIKAINASITVSFVHLDLADQASIRKTADAVSAKVEKIHYLINCAGVMAVPTFETTKDGIELQFGSNHIGHFLLTNLLLSKILTAGKGSRIVNVSSNGYELAGVRFDDYNFKVNLQNRVFV